MKLIGLAGAHRTGKSTLAERFSEVSGYTLVVSGASGTFKRLGMDPKADYPLDTRIAIQEAILEDMEKTFEAASVFSVIDRTPVDMAAYLLADVSRASVTPKQDARVVKYVDRCMALVRKHFSVIVVVQPGIEVKEEEGKAPGAASYMEHINMLCLGMITAGGLTPSKAFSIGRRCVGLDDRVDLLVSIAADIPAPFNVMPYEQRLPM